MKIDKRKITQLATSILYNCNFLGFKNSSIYTGNIKKICVPGLNCYSCPGAIASCPIGSFQSFIMQKRGVGGIIARIPFYVIGFLILFGVIFGRAVCGFLCPFGFLQEIIYFGSFDADRLPVHSSNQNGEDHSDDSHQNRGVHFLFR